MGFLGKFQGWCVDNNDPLMVGRIRAEVPFPLGRGRENWSTWALPCLPPGHFEVPKEGDGVWVEFLDGDPNRPVWVGIWYKGRGTDTKYPTTAPMQETHDALTDFDGNVVDPDKVDGETDPVALAEHTDPTYGHDHQSKFYTPHRRVWQSETGHSLEWNDHPGKDGYARLFERYGRMLEFLARGVVRLAGRLSTVASNEWQDLNGTTVDARHSLVFADKMNDGTQADAGQYIELKDMAGTSFKMTSTPGSEKSEWTDFWGQRLTVNTVKGSEFIEFVDKAGQKVRFDPVAGTIRIDDKNSNYVLMQAGKIHVFCQGDVTVEVPDGHKVNIGGEAGQQLATKDFVQQQYNTHTHLSGSPGSPTSPPMAKSPLSPGNDITRKQFSE